MKTTNTYTRTITHYIIKINDIPAYGSLAFKEYIEGRGECPQQWTIRAKSEDEALEKLSAFFQEMNKEMNKGSYFFNCYLYECGVDEDGKRFHHCIDRF